MFGSVNASDVFFVALIVMLMLTALLWFVARSTVREPSVPVPRPPMDAATVRRVSDLVAQDKRIEAIKVLREATRLGLKESKDWVDAWDGTASHTTPPSAVLTPADAAALETLAIEARAVRRASGDITAIKYVREQTHWGLADAKAYVDRLA